MSEIFKSASKLVLLYIVLILGILTLTAGVLGIVKGTLEPKEIIVLFSTALNFVLGFYFGSKGDPTQPYAGK